MADDPIQDPQVRLLVQGIMNAVSDASKGAPLQSRNMLTALNFLTAIIIEASPDVDTGATLKRAVEIQRDWIQHYAEHARGEFESSGVRAWEVLNKKRSVN